MRKKMSRAVPLVIIMTAMLCGCKKKEDTTIIVPKAKVTRKVVMGVGQMSPFEWHNTVQWMGSKYMLRIVRKPDKSLQKAKDENGRDYYDNNITLTIQRADGTDFFSKTFTKADFKQYVPDDVYNNGALLGLVYDHCSDGSLYFGTSVGSPDNMSDEYVPLVLIVDRFGNITVKKDVDLEGSPEQADDEVEASEKEGI